ncbi:MAG: Flp family type IVb pilin [Myxococcales bacterium]|nr:Flp family type IVb pilin [Myxococcales bacterium]
MHDLTKFLVEEDGATAIEYGLIVSVIFLVIVGSVTAVANNTVAMWATIAANVN